MTISEAFSEVCRRVPEKVAVTDGDVEGDPAKGRPRSFSYAALGAVAAGIARLVASTTDRQHVGMMLPGCKEFPAVFFGLGLAGRIPTPLNFLLHKDELGYIVKDSGLDTIITSEYFRPILAQLPLKLIVLEEVAPKLAAASARPAAAGTSTGPAPEVAALLYTSGTTGYPKGVMLTHENLLSNVKDCKEYVGFHEGQVFLGILPLFHSFALTCSMLVPLLSGGSVVLMKKFHPARVAEAISDMGINVLLGIASQFRALATPRHGAAPDRAAKTCTAVGKRPHSLEICVAGGEALPEDVRVSFERAFEVPLHEGYGMTESAPVVSVNTRAASKPGTVGRPLPSVSVKIVDDAGREVAPDLDGEILVRGPNVMKGYLNQPEATRTAVCAEGWLRTGDIGRLDADGFLRITGRKKEMILSSGENIFPSEIERCLLEHPAVAECAVVGVIDTVRGEAPKAFVVLREGQKSTESELRDYARGRIAAYKVPKCVEFRTELPHGPTGKVLKKNLK
ncbi:MAG: AMP-binding protein [Planctomycetota bacterium]|nr:AMP-binding protein [Planctomycetota bacterium]